jgi:uncharacterized sulfatase
VVVILADDLGLGDLSATGSTAIDTPNIDRMADQGTLLSNYYAPSPVCSPSRAGLLTGRLPSRTLTPDVYMGTGSLVNGLIEQYQKVTGTYALGNDGIPADEILLPEVLRSRGYATGLVGKWHLGIKDGQLPNDNGFDDFYGALFSNDMAPYRIYRNTDVVIDAPVDQSTLTRTLTTEAVSFIDRNRDRPFFLYYASPFPHYPAHASDEFAGTSQAGTYGDSVQELDWSVGQVMSALRRNGLAQRTMVVFTSDNGPWFEGDTSGLRGRKNSNYDGGQQVPFIAWMPGAVQAGRTAQGLTSGLDLFPTVLDLIGLPPPTDRIIDGVSLKAMLTDGDPSPRTRLLLEQGMTATALISDGFKYLDRTSSDMGRYWLFKQGPYLYDLAADPRESYDVSTKYPDEFARLQSELAAANVALEENVRGWLPPD